MRILQLIAQTTLGGAETFGFTLSEEFARRGHEVLLLANRANGPLLGRACPPGMRLRALDRTSRRDPRIVSFLVGAIREFRPDVLHSHNFECNTWARALTLVFPRLPVVCHDHSGRKISQPPHRIWIDRILFRRCAAIFVVNEELGRLLRTRHRVPERLLHVLPNGIDLARYALPAGHERTARGVVCVASLTEVKNHRGLLAAWKTVVGACPEATLTLVGDGDLRAALERQAADLGIERSVRFAGLSTDVRPFLWDASTFVLFSRREALPLSILEAMAAGMAVVAPALGGIPEAVEDQGSGTLFEPGNEEALARSLIDLLADDARRVAYGRRGRVIAEERFDLAKCLDRIEQVYRDIRRPSGRAGRTG